MSQPSVSLPLVPDALETNRAGRLTDSQRSALRAFDRGPIGNNLLVAAFAVVLAVVLFMSHSPARNASWRPLAGVAALAAAAWLLLRSFGIGGRLAHDLKNGRVDSVEGPILKDRSSTGSGGGGYGRTVTAYALEIAGRSFWVMQGTYEAAPDAGIVRLYYLPESHRVVNLERLADAPLPANATAAPLDLLKSLAPELHSRDRAARANAGAELAALGSAMQREQAHLRTPPPISERDPRPLAEAIVGRWQDATLSLDFTADGSVTATLPGSQERRGRWSVDPAGRLHANVTGAEQAGDAWIVGDTLTLVGDAKVLTLRRAPSSAPKIHAT